MELWQNFLNWAQSVNTGTLIAIIIGVLIVSAVISFIFRLVKTAVIVVILLLIVGISPTAITNWIDSHMSPQNFGVSKMKPAADNLLALPTDWITTFKNGNDYVCKPDLTPDGLGGLNCDHRVFPDTAKSVKSGEKYTVNGFKECEKTVYGFKCPVDVVMLEYKKV